MDNASWHHSEKLMQMCWDAGIILEFLSPYSHSFNPIEEYFRVLKKFIKKKWHQNKDFIASHEDRRRIGVEGISKSYVIEQTSSSVTNIQAGSLKILKHLPRSAGFLHRFAHQAFNRPVECIWHLPLAVKGYAYARHQMSMTAKYVE